MDIDNQELISLFFYYDKEPSEDECELASLADTEFIADFPLPAFRTDCRVLTWPYPKAIPKSKIVIYKKYEPKISKSKISISDLFSCFFTLKKKDNEVKKINRGTVICTIQKALLGKITENLRAVVEDIDANGRNNFIFYFDQEPTALDKELADFAEKQFRGDLPQYNTEFKIKNLPFPYRVPRSNQGTIYERYEDRSQLI